MKLLLSFAAVLAVAVAVPAHRGLVAPGPAGPAPAPEPIAIGPAIIDSFEPISIGPAIIDTEPVAVGPAWIDFPLPDGGAASAPVKPSPVAVIPGPVSSEVASGSPLVQIILNINHVVPEPVAVGPAIIPEPVHVEEIVPEPVQVVEAAPEPVQVVEEIPHPVESIVVETPEMPNPVNPPIVELN